MIKPTRPLTLAICTAMACAPVARGAVTYINATLANTNNAAGGADSTWADGNDGTTGGTVADGTVSTNDSKWKYRGGFGVNGIWEATSSSSTPENAFQLKTSVLVPNGTYNVYVFFVPVGPDDVTGPDLTDKDFPIRAGNTAGTLELFDQLGSASGSTYTGYVAGTVGKNALSGDDALAFTSTLTRTDATRPLLYGLLSTTQVVDDGTLEVFIDDFPALGTSGSSDSRTWYDGIGFQVVPEPSTALLGGLGALALLRRRRVG